MRTYVYPGSFDPVTTGHLDLIKRASKLCDKLIVSVLNNNNKKSMFSLEERVVFLNHVVADIKNVEVDSFPGLLVDFLKKRGSSTVIKGLRTVSDFEYELQMAMMNKKLCPDIETLFMMTGSEYSFISSTFIRDIARNNGNLEGLVPDEVMGEITKKLGL